MAINLISTSPADGEELADLADVEVVWESDDLGDPIDPTSFTITRMIPIPPPGEGLLLTFYDLEYVALGAGRYLVRANVGLFPGDTAISITAGVLTESELEGGAVFTFDCRDGVALAGVADTPEAQVQSAIALAELKQILQASTAVLASITRTPELAAYIFAVFTLTQLTGAADITPAHISVARAFLQMLMMASAGQGAKSANAVENALTAEWRPDSPAFTLLEDENALALSPATNDLGIGVENTFKSDNSVVSGSQAEGDAEGATDIPSGDGVRVQADVCSTELDAAREE